MHDSTVCKIVVEALRPLLHKHVSIVQNSNVARIYYSGLNLMSFRANDNSILFNNQEYDDIEHFIKLAVNLVDFNIERRKPAWTNEVIVKLMKMEVPVLLINDKYYLNFGSGTRVRFDIKKVLYDVHGHELKTALWDVNVFVDVKEVRTAYHKITTKKSIEILTKLSNEYFRSRDS